MPQHASLMPRHAPENLKNKNPRTLSLFHSSKPSLLQTQNPKFPPHPTLLLRLSKHQKYFNSYFPYLKTQISFNNLLEIEWHWKNWIQVEIGAKVRISKFQVSFGYCVDKYSLLLIRKTLGRH